MTGERIGLGESKEEIPKLGVEKILIAGNRGPCGGVNMALEATNQVLEIVNGREPVYSLWDIVHNKPVMEELTVKGLISVNYNLTLVPDNSIAIKPAHGGPPWLDKYAEEHEWHLIDVTCPLVEVVQDGVRRDALTEKHTAYIGVEGHPETVGVLGVLESLGKVRGLDYVLIQSVEDARNSNLDNGFDWVVRSQTTLMPAETDEIEAVFLNKYPDIYIPDKLGICYATYNRQEAVDDMVRRGVQRLVVVGSPHSHNSQMLARRGERLSVPSERVDNEEDLDLNWLLGADSVGLTSGASVLDKFMEPVTQKIANSSPKAEIIYLEQVKPEKWLTFKLPKQQIESLESRWAA